MNEKEILAELQSLKDDMNPRHYTENSLDFKMEHLLRVLIYDFERKIEENG